MLFLAQDSCAGAQLCADRFLSPSLQTQSSQFFFQTMFPFLDDCIHWQYLIRNHAFTSLKCSIHSKEKDRLIIYFRCVFTFEFLGVFSARMYSFVRFFSATSPSTLFLFQNKNKTDKKEKWYLFVSYLSFKFIFTFYLKLFSLSGSQILQKKNKISLLHWISFYKRK